MVMNDNDVVKKYRVNRLKKSFFANVSLSVYKIRIILYNNVTWNSCE